MKNFFAVVLSLFLIFSMAACNNDIKNTDSKISDVSQDTNSVVSRKSESNGSNEKFESGSGQSDNTNKSNTNQTVNNSSSKGKEEWLDKETVTNNNINQTTQNNSSQSDEKPKIEYAEKIDNGILEKVTAENMNVPENMKLLGTDDAKEKNNSKNMNAAVALYQLDGNVVNWTTENDLIYVITSGNNRLVVIDSKNMAPVSNVALAGKPAEINLMGDEIYISLPDLCRIDIFSKSNFAKMSSLNFEHEISSFCIDGDYIYYSEHDQHCDVYRKNMTTTELTKIIPDRGWSFYQPKLYLNKRDNILYIGETGSTGNALYYYDATTLQLKSFFRKDNYGLFNHTRDIFHVGNEIFWGNYRLSDTNAKVIVGRYGEAQYGSVNFASENLVSTFEGLFLTDTYECIIDYFDAGFKFEYILVTESNNIFFRSRSIDKNVIIGVNFSMQ